jgi:hypothetical protein
MSLSTPNASGTCRSMNRFVLCAHSRRAVRLGTMRGFLWYSRRLAWATAGARGERQVPAGLLDACIGLAVPGRPIGPCSRRTGAPKASATGRDRTPMLTRLLTRRATRPRDERVQDGTTLWHLPTVKAW